MATLIDELVKVMQSIDKDKSISDAVLWKAMDDETDDARKIMIEMMAYKGFDAKVILVELAKKFKSHMAAKKPEELVKFTSSSAVATYTNNQTFPDDMAFLVLMFGNGGSRVDKMEKKSEDSFIKFFRILKAKYAIDTTQRKSGERVNPKVITLPRIAACFPSMMCDFMARDYIRTLFIGSELGLEKLSKGVLNTSITALISKAWPAGKMIIPFAVAVKTDEVLTQREKQKNTLETMFTYFSAKSLQSH